MITEREFPEKYPDLNKLARARSRISRWSKEEIISVMIDSLNNDIPEMIVLTATPLIIRLADSLNRDLKYVGEGVIAMIKKAME